MYTLTYTVGDHEATHSLPSLDGKTVGSTAKILGVTLVCPDPIASALEERLFQDKGVGVVHTCYGTFTVRQA